MGTSWVTKRVLRSFETMFWIIFHPGSVHVAISFMYWISWMWGRLVYICTGLWMILCHFSHFSHRWNSLVLDRIHECFFIVLWFPLINWCCLHLLCFHDFAIFAIFMIFAIFEIFVIFLILAIFAIFSTMGQRSTTPTFRWGFGVVTSVQIVSH